MVRNYELAFLIKEGEAAATVIERLKGYLTKIKATVVNENEMGIRQLAYTIRKNREDFTRAFYYFVKTEMKTDSIPALERHFKFDEGLIRYMILVEN
jgi:small subunit ribosomal protein S6